MIQWIHRNKRSLSVFLIMSAAAFSMSMFGIDMGQGRGARRDAIKVNDQSFSFDDFLKEKRNKQEIMMAQYRKLLGDNFNQFAAQLMNIPDQAIIDDIIAETLFKSEAARLDIHSGPEQLISFIKNDIFEGNFDSIAYSQYLSRNGLSSRVFEDNLRESLKVQNYRRILADAALPSRRETRGTVERQETKYDIDYIEIDPAAVAAQVPAPEDETLESYYTDRQTDYEVPALVSYQYIVLDPQKFTGLVNISEEDIEVFYADNEAHFSNPEQVSARHIQITVPPGADDKKMEELQAKAEEAHAKATAGEDFSSLVSRYSDDLMTLSKGGDLGWISPGKMDKSFDDAVFRLKVAGIVPLITTDYGYEIVKIEEYKPAAPKQLDEVRGQIEAELRKREAPAYTSLKATEIYDSWLNDPKPAEEIAKAHDLTVSSSGGLIGVSTDPDSTIKGLTKSVIASADQPIQIIEMEDKTVLVQISEFQEPNIPAFAGVKEKVLADYRRDESVKLAKKISEDIIAEVNAAEDKPEMKKIAEKFKLKLQEQKDISRKAPGSGVFADREVQSEIFSTFSDSEQVKRSFEHQGKIYVLKVKAIRRPDAAEIAKEAPNYTTEATQRSAGTLIASRLNSLKAGAEIDVDQTLFTSSDPANI